MLHVKSLFYLIVVHLINATPQINLYFTDKVTESTNVRRDCLYISTSDNEWNINQQIISYCISESSLELLVKKNHNPFPRFTFDELSKENISSEQLYIWSAPIDLIERYQFYLDHLLTSNEIFYNCTLPRFGSMCQYQFDFSYSKNSSLYDIIRDFYSNNPYRPIDMTCYNDIECDRGYGPTCLDWSEICDGHINCLNDGIDEKHCWQLEINQCKHNEYRCIDGQCIPISFVGDHFYAPDCLDNTDEYNYMPNNQCENMQPSLICEDTKCTTQILTSSCSKQRYTLLTQELFSKPDIPINDSCWFAIKCSFGIRNPTGSHCRPRNERINTIEKTCPDMFYVPSVPLLFGNIYFAYMKNNSNGYGRISFYICYNNSLYDEYFINTSKTLFNDNMCYRNISMLMDGDIKLWNHHFLEEPHEHLHKYVSRVNFPSLISDKSNMYQCINSSKLISIHRVMDLKFDCPYSDDENNQISLTEDFKRNRYKCSTSGKYIFLIMINNGDCNCGYDEYGLCEDEMINWNYIRQLYLFQFVCNGIIDLEMIHIDGQNTLEETNCEQWPCDNIYNRCDGIWNCIDGKDELNFNLLSSLNCASTDHICISSITNQLMCLSIEKITDGNVDCIGGIDEPKLCRRIQSSQIYNNFRCMNVSSEPCVDYSVICDGRKDCIHGDDEQFCQEIQNFGTWYRRCNSISNSHISIIEKIVCQSLEFNQFPNNIFFKIDEISKSTEQFTNTHQNSFTRINEASHQNYSRCHRGLNLRIWLNDETNATRETCLCPPSYYGDRCQYQNQRISLIINFRALSVSWKIPFAIIISLIDDQRIIHSYEQFTYLSMRDCHKKFHINLPYSSRSKDYAIHIDIYEKVSLVYRGSLFKPINFPFLPVQRLAFIIDIPRNNRTIETCSNHQCIHGKCIQYLQNSDKIHFCQCNRGWTGKYCNIPFKSMCYQHSLDIGVSADNRSVCVCPIHRFGPRCLLINRICQSSPCQNADLCLPKDEHISSIQNLTCICSKGYHGERCEIADKKIILSFEKTIIVPSSILIHFIEVIHYDEPKILTTFKTININQDLIIIHWLQTFHLVFIEFFKKDFYLAFVEKTYNQSTSLTKIINPSDRCRHINELFNKSIIELHIIHRIKYYHLPCQTYSSQQFSCFYDEFYLCLCYDYNQQRLSNCIGFNFNTTFDCLGQSECENDGQCFQDTLDCSKTSACLCLPCFFGTQCQFSTSGFGLSLDAILGYHIIPNINIKNQPSIVQTSIALNIIFLIAALIDGILSVITFNNKTVCRVGCGIYLLGSSITTIFTMIMFGLKFWILILTQMSIIQNRTFLLFECYVMDFFLKICLYMDQWLNACVATERAFTTIRGARFNTNKSKKAAKLIIIILLIIILITNIHDPIYRKLIDEQNDNEERIWCVVKYPSHIQKLNNIMNIFYFFGPFFFNVISAIILITKKSRQQSTFQIDQTFKTLLKKQFQQHKHLIIAPIVLTILTIPRLIISFASKCLRSKNGSWLFLIGYFISFIPSMLTFIIFILPSKFYKKQFRKTIAYYQTRIKERLYVAS